MSIGDVFLLRWSRAAGRFRRPVPFDSPEYGQELPPCPLPETSCANCGDHIPEGDPRMEEHGGVWCEACEVKADEDQAAHARPEEDPTDCIKDIDRYSR